MTFDSETSSTLFLGLLNTMRSVFSYLVVFALLLSIANASQDISLGVRDLPTVPLVKRDNANQNEILPDARIYGPFQSKYRKDVPILGNIGVVGRYYSDITIEGSTYRVVLDTGSSVLYLPAQGCKIFSGSINNPGAISGDCDSLNPYVPTPSVAIPCGSTGCSSCNNSVCAFETLYGDNSWAKARGYNVSMTVGSYSTPEASVGLFWGTATNYVVNDGTIDGLWGMGYQVYEGYTTVTIPTTMDSLVAAGMPNIFSIYLQPNGGVLTLGGINNKYTSTGIKWIPIVSKGWYVIPNPGMQIGGKSISISVATGTISILDSGATLINLPPAYYDAMKTEMQKKCPQYMCAGQTIFDSARWCYPTFPFDDYPTISFTMNGHSFVLTPRQYMVYSVNVNGAACYAFGIARWSENFLILGDTFMTQYYSIFDRANDRIGLSALGAANSLLPSFVVIAFLLLFLVVL